MQIRSVRILHSYCSLAQTALRHVDTTRMAITTCFKPKVFPYKGFRLFLQYKRISLRITICYTTFTRTDFRCHLGWVHMIIRYYRLKIISYRFMWISSISINNIISPSSNFKHAFLSAFLSRSLYRPCRMPHQMLNFTEVGQRSKTYACTK